MAVCLWGVGMVSAAETPVTGASLLKEARSLDGATVCYEGEVVGEVLVRGDHAWVNVHDGTVAIGCWLSRDFAAAVSRAGNYRQRGDWVTVTGTFRRSCPQHGGDLDIHATHLRLLRPGRPFNEKPSEEKKRLVFVLAGGICLLLILKLFKKPQPKRSSA